MDQCCSSGTDLEHSWGCHLYLTPRPLRTTSSSIWTPQPPIINWVNVFDINPDHFYCQPVSYFQNIFDSQLKPQCLVFVPTYLSQSALELCRVIGFWFQNFFFPNTRSRWVFKSGRRYRLERTGIKPGNQRMEKKRRKKFRIWSFAAPGLQQKMALQSCPGAWARGVRAGMGWRAWAALHILRWCSAALVCAPFLASFLLNRPSSLF